MKKLLSFLLVSVFVFTLGFSSVSAEYSEGDELIPNGDLSFNAGELLFPDPVFDSDFGPAEGWGSLAFDSRAIALTDPDDVSNTVLKLSLSDAGENWSSFFRFLPIQTSTVYNVSIDFKIVGTTDNIGIRFAGAPALEVVFLDHPSKTAIEGKDGWHNVQFQFDTTTGTYDSIALWFHTMGSADNYALLDNISIIADGTTNEINEGGDFEGFLDYTKKLDFPDPVFDSNFGPAEGWGSLAFDSRAIALTDPDDVSNTVLKLSLSDAGENWSSFFRFLPIQTSTVYNVSIDFKIVGTTDNIGIRFAGAPALEVVFLDHPSKTAIEGKDGWHNVQFQFDTTTGTYDSIALWFHTMGSADNYALLDNISIIADGTTNEINEGGDFEGFLDFVPGLELTASTDANGYFGALAAFGNGKATINDGGHLAYEKDFTADMHRVGFDFEITDLTNGNVSVGFYDSSDTLITSAPVVTNGVLDLNNVTEDSNVYTFNADIDVISAASYIKFDYSGDSVLLVDNLSAKKLVEIPDNPFDPDTIYYETTQLLENGDFEAFDVDTVFSEEQLEGAWGSISLDGPAKIMSVDGSKVMAIGQTSGKMYSSSFVMNPPSAVNGKRSISRKI